MPPPLPKSSDAPGASLLTNIQKPLLHVLGPRTGSKGAPDCGLGGGHPFPTSGPEGRREGFCGTRAGS